MPHPDEPSLVAYVARNPSQTALAVYDASDLDAARAALEQAAAKVREIRHPDDPDCSLPNWCAVTVDRGVPVLHLDMKDEVAYAALVVRIILDRLSDAGVGGRLAPRREAEEPFPYDPEAARYTDMDRLAELDPRGLPPGFPEGFPVPDEATLVLAERWQDGDGEHAAWRRSVGPFAGYLARLRDFGCTFGPVPRLLTVGPGPDVAYTLWRQGAGGSVAFYRSHDEQVHATSYWYVSAVWYRPGEPPTVTVEPDENPDRRQLPTGAGAARELAEFLVAPQLVPAYEAVLALAAAANALHRLTRNEPDQADRRPKPVVLASRFAQVFGRLDGGQLALLRHACLVMAENLLASGQRGRPAGLTIRSDDDGRWYAEDLRDGPAAVVPAELMPCFETGVTLVQAMPMVGEALHGIRTAPARPPADRYLWLFEGLEVAQLEATRDACWQLFQP